MAVNFCYVKFQLHNHDGVDMNQVANDAIVDGFEIWRVHTS